MPLTTRNLLLMYICLLLLSCGGDGSSYYDGGANNNVWTDCSIEGQNQYVHEVLLEFYLWYDQIESVIDYSAFNSPEETLDFLRYENPGNDHFSYIMNRADFDSLFTNAQYTGYGFSFISEADGSMKVRFVYNNSAAGRAGLMRGDKLLMANELVIDGSTTVAELDSLFSQGEEGQSLSLLVERANSPNLTLALIKGVIDINTVLHHSTLTSGSDQVGYLMFNKFLETSTAELVSVFADFNSTGVNKLIIDLRYNGGGIVDVANTLASYLYAAPSAEQYFAKLIYNDKHQNENTLFEFTTLTNALSLDQVIVITSGQTASASEMLINGLTPFVDVRVVGDTTVGKPVGMNGFLFCEKVLLPITFATTNHNDESFSFDGIPADCPVDDDVNYAFGDSNEPMLAEALYLMANDSCQTAQPRTKRHPSNPSYPPDSLRALIGAY